MPIRNSPFTHINKYRHNPALGLKFIRPGNPKITFSTIGIIDTGAERCSLPFIYAGLLGYNESNLGKPQPLGSAGGKTVGYPCVINVEIYDAKYLNSRTANTEPNAKKSYLLCDVPVYFIKTLDEVLIGSGGFLDQFILKIDYPNQIFSLYH